jgi:hypothetical protein
MKTITRPCKPFILIASVKIKFRSTDFNNWGFKPEVVEGVHLPDLSTCQGGVGVCVVKFGCGACL